MSMLASMQAGAVTAKGGSGGTGHDPSKSRRCAHPVGAQGFSTHTAGLGVHSDARLFHPLLLPQIILSSNINFTLCSFLSWQRSWDMVGFEAGNEGRMELLIPVPFFFPCFLVLNEFSVGFY